jgi:hypothetical protein
MIYKGLLQDYICQINFFSFDNYYVINENVENYDIFILVFYEDQ